MSVDPTIPIWLMAAAFFAIALVYASVGFGGGSSYTALLAMVGFPAAAIPVLALGCNLVVSSGGCVIFARRGKIPVSRLAPFVLPAVPAAYVGGRIPLAPERYFLLLGISLAVAGVLLLFRPRSADVETRRCTRSFAMVVGCGLGLLSGVVGIGGGIFLSPLLLLKRWATPRESAACASVFIALNSLAGLAGQLSKPAASDMLAALPPLLLAVLVGGQLGSRLGAQMLPPRLIRQGTACLVLMVSARLLLGLV